MEKTMPANVATVFNSYPEAQRKALLEIRQLIFKTATELGAVVGEIDESLKWNQPSYATNKTQAGTPIRLALFEDDQIIILVHCQTTLIENFRALFSDTLTFSKTRGIVLNPKKTLPIKELTFCISEALTYHKK